MSSTRSSAGEVLLAHGVSVGVLLGITYWTEETPRPAIYGLFVNYFYRLVTLVLALRLGAARPRFARRLARWVTRPPHPGRPAYQVTVGEHADARPGNIGVYLLVLAVLAYFSVMEINAANQEFATPMPVFAHELLLGLSLGLVWWLLDLVERRVTVRFDRDLVHNLGYNSAEITVVAFTALTGGVVSAFIASPWPYFLALVAWKALYDVLDEIKFPRGEHAAA